MFGGLFLFVNLAKGTPIMKRFLTLTLSAALLLLCALMAACVAAPTAPTDTSAHQTTPNQDPPSDTSAPETDGDDHHNSETNGPDTPAGSPCNHTYGDWLTTKEPSCTEAGSQVRICSLCSYAQTAAAPALGHTTEAGVCDRCGEILGADQAETIRDIIEIYDVYVVDINSAGGVEIGAAFTNTSNKTIKYIRFYVTPYNAVGDPMYCEIQGHSHFEAYVTGPLEPGHEGYRRYGVTTSAGHYWDNCWWNAEISYIELTGVKIEYTDGSEFSLDRDTVKLAMTEYPVIDHVTQTGVGTGFSRNYDKGGFLFNLTLLNRHSVSLKRQAKVDVRMVNTDGTVVFEQTYRIDESDFVESQDKYLGAVHTASFTVYDEEIRQTATGTGQLYYRVYSDDGEFSFAEESEFTTDLPEAEDTGDTRINAEGLSYDDYSLTILTPDNALFLIRDVTYTTNTLTGDRLVGTLKGLKIAGEKSYSSKVRIQLIDPNGQVVLTDQLTPMAYDVGDTFEISFFTKNFVEGEYVLRFTDRLTDGNGLYYNLSNDLQSVAAYLSADTVANLTVPAAYADFPVTALRTNRTGSPNLTAISIPATITSIHHGIFADCDKLLSVTVDAANPIYHSGGNCIIETAAGTLIAGCNGSIIPTDGSVTAIGYDAFYNCRGLTHVVVPATVTAIDSFAFAGCSALQTVSLPQTLRELDAGAFSGCAALREMELPAGITEIPTALFEGCAALETVVLQGEVTTIRPMAFSGCQGLKNLAIPATVETIFYGAFDGCDSLTESENGLLYVGNWMIGCEANIFDAVIREGTVAIVDSAFYGCSTLRTVNIPDSVRKISAYAFDRCYNLREVTLGSGLTLLEYHTFSNCYTLTDVTYNGALSQWAAIEKETGWLVGSLTLHAADGTETCTYDEE